MGLDMTRNSVLLSTVLAAGAAALLFQTEPRAQNQGQIAPGDWPTINRDLAATRYSPLNQINAGNVARLAQAWTFPVQGAGSAVPLVINGTMYVPNGGRVTALDAATGREMWSFTLATATAAPPAPAAEPPAPQPTPGPAAAPRAGGPAGAPGAPGAAAAGQGGRRGGGARAGAPGGGGRGRGGGGPTVSARGVGYWPGDGKLGARIMFMSGNRLWAIDAATGQPAAGFGENGSVVVGIPYGGTPTIYRNVAIIGAASNEVPTGPAPGNPRAFDVVTGQKLWEFQTVPRAGEPFNETWGDGWKDRQGTNMWAFSAPVDVERGIVYLPIAGPAANYYGGDRPGNNVFANSIVAVDAQTGKYLWHFQTVHHDLWDIDLPSAGALLPVQQNGKPVPAIAHVGKSSYFYVLNRLTGAPIIPVEERPVPKGDVPTEWYSPTQPIPVRPGPLSPTSFNADTDLVRPEDTTPEHAAACRAMIKEAGGYINLGPFTPFMFKANDAPPRSTIQLPGGTGGVNWGGVAADPTTGLVYANAQTGSLVGWVEEKDPKVPTYSFDAPNSPQPYDRASVNGKGPFFTFSASPGPGQPAMPCLRPPWGQLVAVNANTGEIVWRSVLGIRENLPEGKQLVGNSGSAGPTVTAGGLVFVGATNDRRFRAFDAKSGKQLWEVQLGGNATANPMTYTGRNGRQYVAVISGATVNAFALP